MPVTGVLLNPNGGFHGGAIASLPEAATGATSCIERDAFVSTVYLETHYVGPWARREGTLYATAGITGTASK